MSGTSGKGLTKGGPKIIRLRSSISRPTNSSSSPSPITNYSSPLQNSQSSQFSSPRIQIPVFNPNELPPKNVQPPYNLSSTLEQESPQSRDPTMELNVARRGKTQIWHDGNGLFCPEYHGKIVRQTTEIFKGKFDAAYPSWGKAPKEVRDFWFNELMTST